VRLLAPLALALIVAATLGWEALADDAAVKSAPMSRGWVFGERSGVDLFDNVCAACHQPDAKGAAAAAAYPPLAADKKLASADFVLTALFKGLRGMPPLGEMMTDGQVADVVNYVRTHFGNSYTDIVSASQAATARRTAAP
jgi:mono/diheme cytochrome c family protein